MSSPLSFLVTNRNSYFPLRIKFHPVKFCFTRTNFVLPLQILAVRSTHVFALSRGTLTTTCIFFPYPIQAHLLIIDSLAKFAFFERRMTLFSQSNHALHDTRTHHFRVVADHTTIHVES